MAGRGGCRVARAALLISTVTGLATVPSVRAEVVALTDRLVTEFMADYADVLGSQNPDRVIAFLRRHYLNDTTTVMDMSIAMPGASEPVLQTLRFTPAEQIAQLETTREHLGTSPDYHFSVELAEINVADDGSAATVVYRTDERSTLPIRSEDGGVVELISENVGDCSATLLAGYATIKVAAISCRSSLTARR